MHSSRYWLVSPSSTVPLIMCEEIIPRQHRLAPPSDRYRIAACIINNHLIPTELPIFLLPDQGIPLPSIPIRCPCFQLRMLQLRMYIIHRRRMSYLSRFRPVSQGECVVCRCSEVGGVRVDDQDEVYLLLISITHYIEGVGGLLSGSRRTGPIWQKSFLSSIFPLRELL